MSADATTVVVEIEPATGLRRLDFRELAAYRELLYFLVWRDIKVRYKQTVLGAAWAILQPVMTMAVFSVFLGRLAHVPSDGIPYPLFSFVALVPWTYFATAVSGASASVVASQQLISKVYFPRLLIPLAAVVTPLVDFGFALLDARRAAVVVPRRARRGDCLAAGTDCARRRQRIRRVARPRDADGPVPRRPLRRAVCDAVLDVRDAGRLPRVARAGRWRVLYGLNPMTGVVEGFRWALVGGRAPGPIILASALVIVVLLAAGLFYFRSAEGTFADSI